MDEIRGTERYFGEHAALCQRRDAISRELFSEFGVKSGLRDENGKGVLTGLTNISEVTAFKFVDGEKTPCDGELLYRGYDVRDLIAGSSRFRSLRRCWGSFG